MKFLFKSIALIVLTINLLGCMVLSTAVSGIGARERYGTTKLTSSAQEISVEIKDVELSSLPALAHAAAFPYISLARNQEGEKIDDITLKFSDIKWLNEQQNPKIGEVQYLVNGSPVIFNVRQHTNYSTLSLENRYRRWYGYPAQSLLLITAPIDVATDIVLLGAIIVVTPIKWGIEAFMNP